MMYAKKSLGQHFLKSERALNKIIEAGEIEHGETVLEIGPGTGVLTKKLLSTEAKIIAIEKDDALYKELQNKLQEEISSGQLKLIHGDILNFEPKSYNLATSTYKLISNIPYNITGAILEKFLSSEKQPERMVLLVQKEVADRVVGNRKHSVFTKESILSLSVKAYGTPKYIETVKAGSFAPAPKVDSAILLIENISKYFFKNMAKNNNLEVELPSEGGFFKLVRAGFSSKRKKLSSNLSQIYDKEMVVKAFETLGLDPNTRAEDVSVDTWGKLARILCYPVVN